MKYHLGFTIKTENALFAFIFAVSVFVSCTSIPQSQKEIEETQINENEFQDGTPIVTAENQFDGRNTILCTFAGDLMAHKPNWSHGHFDRIYEDITEELQESDFAFANFETPVDNSKDYSTFPNFNVKNAYADAAINAGFNVFSLVNNHTNDQGLDSMIATRNYFRKKHEESAGTARTVYAAGIKDSSGGPWTYEVIEKDGWTILFMAVSEIMNRPSYSTWMDFLAPTESRRNLFYTEIEQIRAEHPCDLFILSIHCSDPEYVLTERQSQADFYKNLLNHGVDVVWANHPHVPKKWDVVFNESGDATKMIFYANGNTISAQRYIVNWQNPEDVLEYTGEGFMTQVRFEKTEDGVKIIQVNPILLTTYIMTDGFCCIRKLDDSFIQYLYDIERTKWADYLTKRKDLMEKIKGNDTWQ